LDAYLIQTICYVNLRHVDWSKLRVGIIDVPQHPLQHPAKLHGVWGYNWSIVSFSMLSAVDYGMGSVIALQNNPHGSEVQSPHVAHQVIGED